MSDESPTPGFQDFMNKALPPTQAQGRIPKITSGFGPRHVSAADQKAGWRHNAIDMNYPHPDQPATYPVYCPVAGTVTVVGGSCNIVNVDDGKGYIHGFLHMDPLKVKTGDTLSGGEQIGFMNGKGAGGVVHLHYQLRQKNISTPYNGLIDPNAFWGNMKQGVQTAMAPSNLDIPNSVDVGHNQTQEQAGGNTVAAIMPRAAAAAVASFSQPAVWTNRVPSHEPWPRTMMVDTENINTTTDEYERNTSHNPQFTEDSEVGRKLIGVVDGDVLYPRGPFWRR